MADIFDVLADATRRYLLRMLHDKSVASDGAVGELSVGEMVGLLAISQPTVSKHLKVLRDAYLVRVREGGQHRYYSLDPAPLATVSGWLAPFLPKHVEREAADRGAEVLAARSGGGVPGAVEPVMRSLPSGGGAGVSIGRGAAAASHRARTVLDGVSAAVQQRLLGPLRRVLGK